MKSTRAKLTAIVLIALSTLLVYEAAAALPAPRGAADRAGPPQVDHVTLARRVAGLDVRWHAVPGGDARYVVHRSVEGKPWRLVTRTRATSMRLKGLPPRPTRIRVRALRNGVRGPWSAAVGMTPSDPAWVDRSFALRPVGSRLPSGQACASRVRPVRENRPANIRRNATRGSNSHDDSPRVTGNFTGTTDEILQWVSCKWGVNEDLVRAQAVTESWWHQKARGDWVTKEKWCHPSLRNGRRCPMSVGIFQIAYRWHQGAYEDRNVVRSTAYNADYLWHLWRECYEGDYEWLNLYEKGKKYRAGDVMGCVGVSNAGRWYTESAKEYMARVRANRRNRVWESESFAGDAALADWTPVPHVLNERPIR